MTFTDWWNQVGPMWLIAWPVPFIFVVALVVANRRPPRR